MQVSGKRLTSPGRLRVGPSRSPTKGPAPTAISGDSVAYLDLLLSDAKRALRRLAQQPEEAKPSNGADAAPPNANDARDQTLTASAAATEATRLLDEATRIMATQLRQAERASALAFAEKERAVSIADHLHERNAVLMKELAFVRRELDDTRGALQRARLTGGLGPNGPSLNKGSSSALDRLERDLAAARTLLLRNETRSLEHAADMAAALQAASANQSAALRAEAIQARLESMAQKHESARQEWLMTKQHIESALSDVSAKLMVAQRHRVAAQTQALQSIAQVAAIRCAGHYFSQWMRRRDVLALHDQLDAARRSNEALAHNAKALEDEYAIFKMKHHRVTTSMQEHLDTRRVEVVKLSEENASLSERLASLLRRAGHAAAAVSFATASANGTPGPPSPTAAAPPSLTASPALSMDRRGGDGQGLSEEQQIGALEMYNMVFKVFRQCKQRLNFQCIPVPPIQMHVGTTSSVTSLVIQWTRTTAMGFTKLFALETRISKLRTRLVCCSVATRGKIAAVAVKLSLPVGTLEEQVLRTKKERYEELVTRISSLRAKVESTRVNVYSNFNVKDTRAATEVVDALDRDVTLFLNIIRQVEVDQFQLSLRLTQARLADIKQAKSEPPADPSLPRARSVDHRQMQQAPTRGSAVLRESRALVASLRHAGLAPAVRQPHSEMVRHHALTPLEDFVPPTSDGHRRMLDGTVTQSTFRPVHKASAISRQRAVVERQAAKDSNNKKLILQSVGLSRRGGAVIPFREAPPSVGEYTMKRLQISEELLE